MFLEEYDKKNQDNKFISEIQSKIKNIQKERKQIGNIIEEKVKLGIPKIEIQNILLKTTSLTKNAINNLIEEYYFNDKNNTDYNISDIKHLKYYFKCNNIDESSQKEILSNKDHIENILLNTGKKEANKKIRHTFLLESDTEELYENSKEIMEIIIERKLKTKSEFFYFLLLDFLNNNLDLLKDKKS